jgi:hypothetical protein
MNNSIALALAFILSIRSSLGEGDKGRDDAEFRFFEAIKFIALYETAATKRCVLSYGESDLIESQKKFIPSDSNRRFCVVIVGNKGEKIYRGINNINEKLTKVSDWAKPIKSKTIMELIRIAMMTRYSTAKQD